METMRFSSRVDISEPNPIAKAEAEAKTSGITLGKLNDSNPTKHALAPELLPDIYGAEPRANGMRAKRWPHSFKGEAMMLPSKTCTY